MSRVFICASLLLASSPALAWDTWEQSGERHRQYQRQEETNQALRDIAEQIRQLREQQEWDAPLINRGR